MSKLKHVVKLGSLRDGYKTLANNVKHDIQYDHISLFANKHDINISEVVNSYDVKRIINTAIAQNTTVSSVYREYKNSVDTITNILGLLEKEDIISTKFMIAAKLRLGGSFYELNNPKHITALKEKLKIANTVVNGFKHLIEPRQSLTVPKNSDKASEEIRPFICKPVINEVIISSMLHANFTDIKNWKELNCPSNLHVYGPRATRNGEFVPYIYEYNLMTAHVNKLKQHATSIIAMDVKSYFGSIQIKHLTLMFNEIFKSSKEAQFLTSQLKFNYLNTSSILSRNEDGLTIESNYQHYIANIFMEYALSMFIKQHLANRKHVKHIEVVTYIDDIFFFITYDDIVSHELRDITNTAIYEDFESFLSNLFQMTLNPNKTKFLNRTKGYYDNFCQNGGMGIKELIRLPTLNYIELLNNNIEITDSVFDYTGCGVSVDEWLVILQEIVKVFEGPQSSLLWSIKQLSPIASRVVRTVMDIQSNSHTDFKISDDQEIHSKFIEKYIIERLNEYQFSHSAVLNSNNHFIVNKYQVDKYNNSYHAYLSESVINLKAFMRADNIAFYIAHYADFSYSNKYATVAESFTGHVNGIVTKDSIEELDILKVLQYLYLCRTTNVSEVTDIVNIAMSLIVVFPNKSRFIAGIIKRQLTRIIKFNLDGDTSVFTASSMMYSTINDISIIDDKKFDYFKYSLGRMDFDKF